MSLLARIKVEFVAKVGIDPQEEENLFGEVSELEDDIRDLARQLAEKYPGVEAQITD